ncbi:tumor necrosis factor receptor superfamily member 27 [Rhinoraja longicauda]
MGLLFELLVFLSLRPNVFASAGNCRENEFLDVDGNCKLCKECGPGLELTKDCGFGVGADAECVPCRPNRYKDAWGPQKCKRCLACPLVNRFLEMNCTVSRNAVCGKCLPGFYRKTRLGGILDMECIPCSDPVGPNQPQCISRSNMVHVLSSDTPAVGTALVAVMCSALTTILLAVFLLCFIYCRRLIAEKQSNGLQGPPVNERVRVDSSSSEGQMGDTSTEALMKCSRNINVVNNSAQPSGSTDVVQPKEALFTLRSCFATYLCPSGSDDQDRSIARPAFSSSLPRGSTECQPLVQAIGCSDWPTPSSSEGGMGGKLLGGCGQRARALPGGDPCKTATAHCASGCQCRPQHAPIECTELDLEGYLSDVPSDCVVMAQETAAHYQPSRPQERPPLTAGSVGPDPCAKQPWMRERVGGRSQECQCIRCGVHI